jgi:hypothetical protein
MFTYIKSLITRALKQALYNKLAAIDTDNQTDAQIEEQTELYYELYV